LSKVSSYFLLEHSILKVLYPVPKIILFLNSHYDNVILISHIDSLKDFINQYIHINKNNSFSQVIY
jgi:hypothetical protein